MASSIFQVLLVTLIFFGTTTTIFADNDMLQDICVADLNSTLKVNGFTCKNAANATALDFFSDALSKPGLPNNTTFGSVVSAANVLKIPGLNTLGVSISRVEYAPGGLNPPHSHPRASEIVFVLQGELEVGFITSANVLISKTIKMGEVFVFPKGLVHFQKNNDKFSGASVIAVFNSQLPGTVSIGPTLFAATPPVPDIILAQAFRVAVDDIKVVKSRFAPRKN